MMGRHFTLTLIVAPFFVAWVSVTALASPVPIPNIPPLIDGNPLTSEEHEIFREMSRFAGVPAPVPLIPKRKVALPRVGEKTSYGAPVTNDLARAFQAQMAGDVSIALAALERAENVDGITSRTSFEIALMRSQIYRLAGRNGDADQELRRAGELEIENFGSNVNTRAIRGEFRLWSSDSEGAMNDLARVAIATRHWRLPTSYRSPPNNLGAMFNITNAQIRAFGVLAVAHLELNNFNAALAWAERAEASAANVFAVIDHPFYGQFVPFHADGYYGRAINLAVLGAARLAIGKDRAATAPFFQSAHDLLDGIGFQIPKITVEALRARALLAAGFANEATAVADQVIEKATRQGLADLVWRIEALRGEALLKDGRTADAEESFIRAQAAVEVASGSLATDQAKRRFGIGKDGITRRLVEFSIARGDMKGVFRNLERARARAFVDMLAGRAVASGQAPELTGKIRKLDTRLRAIRLSASSPAGAISGDHKDEAGLLAQRRMLTNRLRLRAPDLADVLSIHNHQLADIQRALKAGEVMVYGLPSEARENIGLFVISRHQAEIRFLKITHRQLHKKLRRFRKLVFGGMDAERQKRLMDEIGADLEFAGWGARRALYVVPTGQLYVVPWGALNISVPVAVLPMGGWLKRSDRSISGLNNVIVGDPYYYGAMPQLPGARIEAKEIASRYDVEPLLGSDARETRIRGNVGNGARILHIATHAMFDQSSPLQSALILAGDGKSQALTAARIYEHPIAARIVILSACETGAGKAIAGGDFLGLVRSFYLGGAHTVINSLWPVSDKGTLDFMQAFHKMLPRNGPGKAWLAARDELKAGGFPPFVYGAFVVGGSIGLQTPIISGRSSPP